jgi:hypothetical protein
MAIHSNRGKTRNAKPYDPEIYDGLQIPKEPTQPVKESVKHLFSNRSSQMTRSKRKGTYFTEAIDEIIKSDTDVSALDAETGEKKLLARFRKNVINQILIRQGWEAFYSTAAPSRNRGAAAGPIIKGSTGKREILQKSLAGRPVICRMERSVKCA